jgi:S-adenosyl-L-methionine hydrolase (adenosine-forming)
MPPLPLKRTAAVAPPIVLLSDFGYQDHYAGVMRGVIATIAPAARVIDLTHGIPPQSVTAGAIALAQSWRYFPPRTIFVGVVDPGVGTARHPIAIETAAGAYFVGPDNGLLALAADAAGFKRAVELRNPRYRLDSISSTFHGRDVFAPAAAHLWLARSPSRGRPADSMRMGRFKHPDPSFSSMGPTPTSIVRIDPAAGVEEGASGLRGEVIYVDGFGNLITNLDRARVSSFAARFRGSPLLVRIKRGAPIRIRQAYGDAPPASPLATFGSFGLLELAVRDGSAAARFAAGIGTPISIKVDSRSSDG